MDKKRIEYNNLFKKLAIEYNLYPAGKINWNTADYFYLNGYNVFKAIDIIKNLKPEVR